MHCINCRILSVCVRLTSHFSWLCPNGPCNLISFACPKPSTSGPTYYQCLIALLRNSNKSVLILFEILKTFLSQSEHRPGTSLTGVAIESNYRSWWCHVPPSKRIKLEIFFNFSSCIIPVPPCLERCHKNFLKKCIVELIFRIPENMCACDI